MASTTWSCEATYAVASTTWSCEAASAAASITWYFEATCSAATATSGTMLAKPPIRRQVLLGTPKSPFGDVCYMYYYMEINLKNPVIFSMKQKFF
jgi:hypothetical protein